MVTYVENILGGPEAARLTAMKQTARKMDVISARLASGLKVNSAIDNPSNYFASLSLKNRAADLSKLLDGISQSIRTLQMADHGIEASHSILDQAESYLENVEQKFKSGVLEPDQLPPTASPVDTAVTFTLGTITPYGGGGQDVPASGTVTVTGNTEINLHGNFWKRTPVNYTITPDTVMIFEFRSTFMPEVAAIGFDNDTTFGNNNNRFFMYGSQMGGVPLAAPAATYQYDGSGNWVTVEIPVGTYFTGTFSHLTFIHDDDAAPYGNTSFRNIVLREPATPVDAPPTPLEKGYQKILNQLDQVVEEANYRGVNLLGNDDLTTYFNPDRSNSLTTEGIDGTYAGLGLDVDDFTSIAAVQAKLQQVRDAKETLRVYNASLATSLSVISTREDLTSAQINNARNGAEDLTIADQNEEGANMLALQTLQQIQTAVMAFPKATVLSLFA